MNEMFCGRASTLGIGEFAVRESGNTKVNKAKWSAPCGIGASMSAVCHFQLVSGPTLSCLRPSARDAQSVPAALLFTESNKLLSIRPIYGVLAKPATMTMVCIGWRHALRERSCIRGVTFLFSQAGPAAASAAGELRKNLPSIVGEVFVSLRRFLKSHGQISDRVCRQQICLVNFN